MQYSIVRQGTTHGSLQQERIVYVVSRHKHTSNSGLQKNKLFKNKKFISAALKGQNYETDIVP